MSKPHIWHPESVAALYEFFRATPPMTKWSLPEADEVAFNVVEKVDGGVAEYQSYVDDSHRISIAFEPNKDLLNLAMTLSHEMVHLGMEIKGISDNAPHGREFRRRARQVCRVHGFDEKAF